MNFTQVLEELARCFPLRGQFMLEYPRHQPHRIASVGDNDHSHLNLRAAQQRHCGHGPVGSSYDSRPHKALRPCHSFGPGSADSGPERGIFGENLRSELLPARVRGEYSLVDSLTEVIDMLFEFDPWRHGQDVG